MCAAVVQVHRSCQIRPPGHFDHPPSTIGHAFRELRQRDLAADSRGKTTPAHGHRNTRERKDGSPASEFAKFKFDFEADLRIFDMRIQLIWQYSGAVFQRP